MFAAKPATWRPTGVDDPSASVLYVTQKPKDDDGSRNNIKRSAVAQLVDLESKGSMRLTGGTELSP